MFTSPYPNAISNGLTDKNPCSNPHQLIKSGFARVFARAFARGFAQIWSAAFSAGKNWRLVHQIVMSHQQNIKTQMVASTN